MVGQICTCPPPVDHGQAGWAHEWLESCPIHGAYVRRMTGQSPEPVLMSAAELDEAFAATLRGETKGGQP